ncbi:DUF6115 domain-containing protein [Jeotgalibaca sp. A127]|uniref:DUF6115 domain-containing protein n=1 Tax=Jeotgalibaca sp. A127 TaxID=3457324 RepID=UPI003FD43924
MELWPIVIVLFALAIILLVVSFFVKEDDDGVITEVAEFTLQMTEEMHILKTRVSQLEKALGNTETEDQSITVKKLSDVTKQQVLSLYKKGKTFDEIAEQLSLPETTVELVIDNHQDSLKEEQ